MELMGRMGLMGCMGRMGLMGRTGLTGLMGRMGLTDHARISKRTDSNDERIHKRRNLILYLQHFRIIKFDLDAMY